MKVARLLAREGSRVKKKDCPHFIRGDALLHFLELKSAAWSTPLFDELKKRGNGSARAGGGSEPIVDRPSTGTAISSGAADADAGVGGAAIWDYLATVRAPEAPRGVLGGSTKIHASSWNGKGEKGLASLFSSSLEMRDECGTRQFAGAQELSGSGSAASSAGDGDPAPPPLHDLFLDLAASPHQIRSVSSSVYDYAAEDEVDRGGADDEGGLFALDDG